MRSLRRVFLPADYAGGDTKYWEAQWLEELRPFGGITARLLQAHLHSPSLLLEAGCGQGEVAVGLAALGHAVIGVDLASEALTDCRRRHPDLPLVVGDVGRLPFRDGAFDAITSLGVVEHFEAGPITILQEHRRVATDNAILLVTVPARGWYRKWSDLLNLRLKRLMTLSRADRIRFRSDLVGVLGTATIPNPISAGDGSADADDVVFTGLSYGDLVEAIVICRDTGLDSTDDLIYYADTQTDGTDIAPPD